MLLAIKHRLAPERGFALVELAVSLFVLTTVAAVAMPAFLAQRAERQAVEARSSARKAVSRVESCYTRTLDYRSCARRADGHERVDATATASRAYTVTAGSPSGAAFTIAKRAGVPARSCRPRGRNGCPASGRW